MKFRCCQGGRQVLIVALLLEVPQGPVEEDAEGAAALNGHKILNCGLVAF